MSSCIIPNYNRISISFTHGKGVWLFAKNGKKYLDFASGVAVNSLGYAYPKLVEALTQQAQRLWHVSNLYQIEEQEDLSKKLCKITKMDAALFVNSGAESVESAIKLARKHTGKKKIISFTGAFHGRTMGALSVTARESIKKSFRPLVPKCSIVELNNIKELKKEVDKNTAAIIFEPIQGEGGVNAIEKKFLSEIFVLSKKYKFLVIADEVQTGVGRTGYFLASDYLKIKPDIICLAKGLGGGFPIGTILTKSVISNSFSYGTHGATFGGNPLACVVAKVVIDEINQPKFLSKIHENSDYLIGEIKKIQKKYNKKIIDVRGKGFLIGVEIKNEQLRDLIIKNLREKYNILVTVSGNNVLRILPPLITIKENIEWFILKLDELLASIE